MNTDKTISGDGEDDGSPEQLEKQVSDLELPGVEDGGIDRLTLSSGEDDGIHVLHIDDDQSWTELTADFLNSIGDGITVTTETNPAVALERLKTDSIDCVISDYQMPEMDGVESLQAVREDFPNLPFILFTGHGSEEIAAEATTAGVTAYVKKGQPEVFQLLANQIERSVARRRSERRARIANDRLLALYEQTDGFYILDHDWTVLYWNEEMAARTELSSSDIVGNQFWDVFPDAVDTELYDELHAVMEHGEPVESEFYYEPRNMWVEVRAYPVDEGMFVHSREITREKQREQELTRRNHILESFANTVSHDFRNPLNVAEGQLQLAQETGDFTHLEEVAKAHNRMRNLIDDLLRHAREGDEADTAVISLRRSANNAWETVSQGGTRLTVVDDAQFEAYQSQLRRVFENLFWNALDHGNATNIRVGTLAEGGFYVEDDGTGIDPEHRERIFEAGFSTSETGTGYGLRIVSGIVEMHDWTLSVTKSENGGARFEVRGVEFEAADS